MLHPVVQLQVVLVIRKLAIGLLDRASLVNVKKCCATKIETVGARSGGHVCTDRSFARVANERRAPDVEITIRRTVPPNNAGLPPRQ